MESALKDAENKEKALIESLNNGPDEERPASHG